MASSPICMFCFVYSLKKGVALLEIYSQRADHKTGDGYVPYFPQTVCGFFEASRYYLRTSVATWGLRF